MKSKLISEAIGTFAILFFGGLSICLSHKDPSSFPTFLVPIVFGLCVSTMIYALGHISGAHFNPAVTLAFTAVRHFPLKQMPFYWIAQVAGAASAILLIQFIFPTSELFLGTVPAVGIASSFVLEIILTFFLMFVIIAVATDTRAVGTMAGLAIGSAVALGAFVGGPLSGGSMNPARSFGPALIQSQWNFLWIYLVAPCLGALTAAFLYKKIRCDDEPPMGKNKNAKGCC